MVPEIIAEVSITYSCKVKASDRFRVTGSKDAMTALRSIWPSYEHVEFMYMMMLNRQNQVLGCHQISKGGMTGTVVDVRVVFQVALKSCATSIILAHNHCSGDPSPSEADIKTTRDLACDFEKSIANFGYGLQAAWYREVLRSVFASEGRLMPDDFDFVFLVVETAYPHGTAVYRMRDDVMDCYSDRLVELQNQWWDSVMKNEYKGWADTEVVEIGLPAWAMKKLQEQL